MGFNRGLNKIVKGQNKLSDSAIKKNDYNIKDIFLGPEYSNQEIKKYFDNFTIRKDNYTQAPDIMDFCKKYNETSGSKYAKKN